MDSRNRTLHYIQQHPGCSTQDILDGAELSDPAQVWETVLALEEAGLVRKEHPESKPWAFYTNKD